MNSKERAIHLKGFLESLKCSDQVSKKQLEILFVKIEELINVIEIENDPPDADDSFFEASNVITKTKSTGSNDFIRDTSASDDLPF